MLIALSECVVDLDTAKQYLKKIIHLTLAKLEKNSDLPGSETEIPLDAQMGIYNLKVENEEEGWLSSVCLIATYLMYGIDGNKLTEKEQIDLGRISAKNINDAWCCYATTMNIFGHEMDTNGLFG